MRLTCSCEEAVRRITAALEGQGFRVARGFDLQEALAAQAEECPCPYHGTERCTCSYTVLLVYGPDVARHSTASPDPSTGPQRNSERGSALCLLAQRIVVHSHHEESWLTLLPAGGDFHTAEPLDAALDARLVRGLAAAMTEAPAEGGDCEP